MYDLLTFHLMQDEQFGPSQRRSRSFRESAGEYLDRMMIPRSQFVPLLELSLVKAWLAAVRRGDESYANAFFAPRDGLSRFGVG